MKSFKSQTVSGIKWTSLSSIILILSTPMLLLIKTRFLSPEEFGYIAILSIIVGFLHKFEGTGFTKGVIQKDLIDIEEASTLFIFNSVLSILLSIILFVSARFISMFFNASELEPYIMLMIFLILLNGPTKYYRAFFEKSFLFKQIGIFDIIRQLILVVSMPIMFLLNWGVLGFIYAQILSNLVILILYLYYSNKYNVVKIKILFNFSKLSHYMRFGLFTSGRGILSYASKTADEIAIGFFLGAEVLGLYHFGKNLLEQVRQVSNKAFAKILFPLFSKLKNDKDKLAYVYKTLFYYLSVIVFPVFIGIGLTANLFVPLIFGDQWNASISLIQIFSLIYILKMITESLSVNLILSINKPDVVFYIELFTTILYFVMLLAFSSMGIFAVIISYALFIVVKTIFFQIYISGIIDMYIVNYVYILKKSLTFSIIMGISVMIMNLLLEDLVSEFIRLSGSVFMGIVVYSALTIVYDKKNILKLLNTIK